ncbi:MAG: hypothetical protein EAZ13_08660 [Sphingobacteriia bacterium]|nr:MAG: hypothetical protein EAZ41_08710 [Sphingobacteriia bacterium]TAG29363.1 MAG: hypothetical protein EAZ35_10975 [Sphingobacteriia bacterium]TAH06636.1 MAG: hypothetical protein EAZ13_08660 [Sphingobacteriia bacterium]
MQSIHKILLTILVSFCLESPTNANSASIKILKDTFYIKYNKKCLIEKDDNREDQYIQYFFKNKLVDNKVAFIMDGYKIYEKISKSKAKIFINQDELISRYKQEGIGFLTKNVFLLYKKNKREKIVSKIKIYHIPGTGDPDY